MSSMTPRLLRRRSSPWRCRLAKRKLLLKAVLNGKELFDAIFDFVVLKYKDKKRLHDALEAGERQFVTTVEMPIEDDSEIANVKSIKRIVVEIREKLDD
jgi:hypothetical protein